MLGVAGRVLDEHVLVSGVWSLSVGLSVTLAGGLYLVLKLFGQGRPSSMVQACTCVPWFPLTCTPPFQASLVGSEIDFAASHRHPEG